MSIQIGVLASTVPSSATGTQAQLCPSTPTPRTSAGSKAPDAQTSAMTANAPAIQSRGSCSTHPGAGVCNG
jgi:hypothetical protein